MSVHRIYNFSAGPAVLPLPVLEEAQRDLIALPGVGMSVMEISHRSKAFEAILAAAQEDMRSLAGIPANYKILFLQGGASLQFSMVPMNLLTAGTTADYIVTGLQKRRKEAKKVGRPTWRRPWKPPASTASRPNPVDSPPARRRP
jgi:phosphoserine aminotransferase